MKEGGLSFDGSFMPQIEFQGTKPWAADGRSLTAPQCAISPLAPAHTAVIKEPSYKTGQDAHYSKGLCHVSEKAIAIGNENRTEIKRAAASGL
ncbi:hypothetical protein EVAR_45816_1 [Eumeta japonica]|uniref:Uncharacterized protein n=1 Tax=Eumeta variegata TaxID=151549 RepID=A0A4C1WPD4_EUMVA|nr:hypothetical protein EVAR_45816_1 [Eumeta japonica]